jgi:RNA polymerase sigma-70 factor (ECF subfamily)
VSTAPVQERIDAAGLVRGHQAEVWRYLRFLGCDESQADDLTQETFLAVLRKPFQYRGRSQAAAYLRTVARHQLLMAARKSRRRPTAEDLETAERVWAGQVGDGGGDSYLDALGDCLEELDGRPGVAIDMFYREDRSRAEIAAVLGMTEDGVKTLLRRTRDVLRRCVERRLNDE